MAVPIPGLYSVVSNKSGKTRAFGFLGKHGRRLAPNEQYTVAGNIIDLLAPYRRKFKAFEKALDTNAIDLLVTPTSVTYDLTSAATKVPTLTGGTLGVANPSWGSGTAFLNAAWTAIPDGVATVASAVLTFSPSAIAPATLTVSDLKLTRDGVALTLGTDVTLALTVGDTVATFSGLGAYTATNGTYVISLPAGRVTDVYGTPLTATASEQWIKS